MVKELAALIGKKGRIGGGIKGSITFNVVIRDAREVFGRTDYLVTPVAGGGGGTAWVSADNVHVVEEAGA